MAENTNTNNFNRHLKYNLKKKIKLFTENVFEFIKMTFLIKK